MRIRTDFRLKGSVLALGAALALAGCGRANEATVEQTAAATSALPDLPATLPLVTGAATSTNYAPGPDALPDVAPIRAVRVADAGRSYAYADAAYDFADALGDAPPDYAFDYDGVDPWAWQGYDESTVFAEPLDDGYRYYYYRSGADAPYFVRDPSYGYGFDGGNLAVVYANDGAVVPWADYGPRVVYASRYLSRGRDLWRASRARRAPVIAANWNARRPAILQSRRAWAEARLQQPGWGSYRARYNRQAGDYWRPEAERREGDARRYAAWQARGYRSAPPPRAIPAGWQRASWARDERRYAPVREERRGVLAARPDRRDDAFEVQRHQAIAAREQALAARAARSDHRLRDSRQEQRAAQQVQRQRAQEQRQAQLAARQQRGGSEVDREALRAQRDQARAAQQAARGEAERGRQAQAVARQQARAAQQAQRADADRGRQAQRAERQQREQARAARQAQPAEPARKRETAVAERQQRQQARAAQQAQAAVQQRRGAERAAQQAQREQAQQVRQQRIAERATREQPRPDFARAQAQQARHAQAAERTQAQQARQAQAAQRAQEQQARQAQQAERAQRDQAQAQRAQAQMAQAAQRAQAEQARAARQQEQAARQQQRAERGPRGGERER